MEGLLGNDWSSYLPADLPASAYGDLSRTMDYQPLDIRKLLEAGAIRITQPGSGTGPEPLMTNDPKQWSLVTKHNDVQENSYTKAWPDKPESYENAISALNSPGALYDGKYRQILWSAQNAGLKPNDIFLKRRMPSGLLGD